MVDMGIRIFSACHQFSTPRKVSQQTQGYLMTEFFSPNSADNYEKTHTNMEPRKLRMRTEGQDEHCSG